MTASSASEGVKLVERLRLGEKPEPVDWALAAAILALHDAAGRFSEAVKDLVDDREKASMRARFVVRANLVAQLSRNLADATTVLQQRLGAYFARRTTEEESESVGPADSPHGGASLGESRHETESGAALEAGGVDPAIAAQLGNAIEDIRMECGWLAGAVDALLESKPGEDEVLDFLSEAEARFQDELFSIEVRGKKQFLAGALEDAVGEA